MTTLYELAKPMPTLDDFNRQELTTPAWHYFKKIDEESYVEIRMKLETVFDSYVATKTDANGSVLVAKLGGLLGGHATYEGSEFYGTVERKPSREARPYECAGPYVQDEIGLLLKLWAERFAPAQKLFEGYDLADVLSLVLVLYHKSARVESLIRVNSMICSLLAGSEDYWKQAATEAARQYKRTRPLQDMRELTKKGVQARQREAIDKDECKRLAAYYKYDHPTAKKEAVADYVRGKKPQLSRTTAMKYIAGYEHMWRMMNQPPVR